MPRGKSESEGLVPEKQTVWLVEKGEYEQSYVAQGFTTEELAREYAGDDGYVFSVDVWSRPPDKVPLWVRIAHVYPDGEVQRGARTEDWDEPGPDPLSTDSPPFDGHMQGHCGWHVYVSGADQALVDAEFERQIAEAVGRGDGTCARCGRTENYLRNFYDTEPVEVTLVGGPRDGDIHTEQKPKTMQPGDDLCYWGGYLLCASFDGETTTNYGYKTPTWDGERWVREFNDRATVDA